MPRFPHAAFAAAVLVPSLLAQIDPVGRVHPKARPLADVAVLRVAPLDRTAISQEDRLRRANGQPARYAIPVAVAADPTTHGSWDELDATWSLWRLRIHAPNSSHVNLGAQQYLMPANARLMVYSSDYQDVVRPFDAADHSASGELWTPVVRTEQIVAEIYVPTANRPQVQFRLVQVGAGYRFFGAGADALPSGIDGASGTCNFDVVCPISAGWAAEIPAVAAMSQGGSIFCTGSLLNNTAQDGKNYFLTAYHCGVTSGNAASLVCYWNYNETTCGGSGAPPTLFTSGSAWRSAYSPSDFTLVELTSTPNPAWGITRLGWNRGTGNSTSAVAIHHPQGDAKKISFEYQATTTTTYLGSASPGDGTHVRVADWDDGTTEPGSSGSPLFDQNRRVIGQLHGGYAACGNNLADWYGRFSTSWTGGGTNTTRLSNWLDPTGTGAMTLNTLGGAGGTVAAATPYGTGCYTTNGAYAQTFAASTFDLGGSAVTTVTVNHAPIANGYTVQSGANAWFTPIAANLGLTDDSVSGVLTLPFAFSFPGGSTTQVRMCSNGYVWLNGTSTVADYQPTIAALVAGPARLAPLWMDLNPTAGGTCHYDVDASNTAVYFTWNNVPHYNTTVGNSCQLVLRNTGAVEFRYRSIGSQVNTCIVGRSRGVSTVPPNTDISVAMPFQVTVDAAGLTFTPVNRPILGTTQTINLTNVPAPASSIGLVVIGFAAVTPALNLAVINAPNCFLYAQNTVVQTLFPLGASTPWNLAIPNTPSLSNSHVYVQGAAMVPPGSNPLGLLTANGVDLLLGTL
ncbi:MAG: trypsin-like peptidase domain-containing protein [Planctomycetota bacterium]